MASIDELNARQSEIRSRLQEIDSEHTGSELPGEAKSEWNTLNEEHERNEKLLGELVARRDRVEALSGSSEHRESATGGLQVPKPGRVTGEDIYDLSTVRSSVSGPEEATRELRDRAKRAIEMADFPHERDQERLQGGLERLVDTIDGDDAAVSERLLRTGSLAYRRAFGKAVMGKPLNSEETRALSTSGSAGGYAVPFTLDPTVIETSSGDINPLREISRREQITGETWKGVSSAGITASFSAQATEASDNAPTLAQPEVTVQKAQMFVPYSIEIGQDWGGLSAEIAKLMQTAKDELEATKFLSGTGTNEPFGVETGATEKVETAASKTFAIGDLYALQNALVPRFRQRSSFLANLGIYNKVRQFDTYGGAALWVRLGEGRPNELLGRPAYELSSMESSVTEKTNILIYGDFNQFLIVDRIGMTVELVPHVFGGENGRPTGQRGLYAYWRVGSKVLTAKAFQTLYVKE